MNDTKQNIDSVEYQVYRQLLKDYIIISTKNDNLCNESKNIEELEYIVANTRFYNEKSDTFNAGVAFGILMGSERVKEISPVTLHQMYTKFTSLVGVSGKSNI